MSIVPILIAAVIVFAIPTLYLAIRFREFRKFLAGAFFVSSGIQFYFWQINLAIPLYGTDFIQTPETSLARSLIHFMLFLATLYFGFIKKPRT